MSKENIAVQAAEPSIFSKLWKRLPLIIRALISGFIVNSIGVFSWIAVLMFVPGYWGIFLMPVLLFIYWQYFSGRWWPGRSGAYRQEVFRSQKLSAAMWGWGISAALLLVLVFQSAFVVTFRFIEFPAESFTAAYNLDNLPTSLVWVVIVLAALVAGICEETGFRGYMQQPLEKAYGPFWSIAIVSTVFVLVHLHQAWAPPVLIHIFAVSAMAGVLAYASGSLLPGIIAHTVLDIFNFSYWWSDVAGSYQQRPISETGVDSHVILWSLVMFAGFVAFTVVVKKINQIRLREEKPIVNE